MWLIRRKTGTLAEIESKSHDYDFCLLLYDERVDESWLVNEVVYSDVEYNGGTFGEKRCAEADTFDVFAEKYIYPDVAMVLLHVEKGNEAVFSRKAELDRVWNRPKGLWNSRLKLLNPGFCSSNLVCTYRFRI